MLENNSAKSRVSWFNLCGAKKESFSDKDFLALMVSCSIFYIVEALQTEGAFAVQFLTLDLSEAEQSLSKLRIRGYARPRHLESQG